MRKLLMFALAASLIATPHTSFAKNLEDLLVEKGVISKGEAASAMGTAPAKLYWNNGTRIEFPDTGFTTQITTFIQTRYTFTDADEDAGASNTSSFDINKARIYIQGSALNNEFVYLIAPDFIAGKSEDGEKSARLVDAYIGWKSCDWATIYMGQWKTGISRQFVASDHSIQTVNRSIISDYFSLGRQQGARFDTTFSEGAFKLSGGIYNGESEGEGINRSGLDTEHTGVVNLRWNAMGKMDVKSEGDIDWSDEAQVSLGAAYAHSEGTLESGDLSNDSFNVDANLKYQGWGFHTEYYIRNEDQDSGDDASPQGFYAQLGYFLDPKTVELAVQYGMLDCDDGAGSGSCSGNEDISHMQVSLNYFWWKHNLKAQLGYDLRSESPLEGDDVNTSRWILQLTAYL